MDASTFRITGGLIFCTSLPEAETSASPIRGL